MISLKCEDCLGTMEIDEDREVLTCPYCGSKKIIPISDAVKIEKIRRESELEMEKFKEKAFIKEKAMLYFLVLIVGLLSMLPLLIHMLR